MSFSEQEVERYARHLVLREIGGPGQQKLKAASVLLVGAGGIGAPAIQYLAAAGVGHLPLIDDDHVSLSNLQRQVLFATDDIGQPKVEAAEVAVALLNPDIKVTGHQLRLTPDNAADLLAGADVVIDGSDNFATRLAVADTACASRIPLISAAVGQFDGQLAVFRGWEADKPSYPSHVGQYTHRPEM
jgi:adenylyltransferase/sulfurtransferase